ncbi:MAG: hypothetical protein C4562_03170 [Actinobacteria bacterium]|nr:MAG: hypothetical protein C4562_03170 [Actinomycetota bacterium]
MKSGLNDEDIGIRTFQIRKEKATERAVEKTRYRLGKEWSSISSNDIDIFSWALGETWAMMGFREWDQIMFSFLDLSTVERIIIIGKQVLNHKKLGTKAFHEIHEILKSLEPPETEEEEI